MLAEARFEQTEKMWIPGGFIDCILMEKLPGQTPHDFWNWPRDKRDELQSAFIDAISYVAVSLPFHYHLNLA